MFPSKTSVLTCNQGKIKYGRVQGLDRGRVDLNAALGRSRGRGRGRTPQFIVSSASLRSRRVLTQ